MSKPTLCLDFDGVVHSYESGWKGASEIPDPPVDGALDFIVAALDHFTVAIYSSRSHQPGGIRAMQGWLLQNMLYHFEPTRFENYELKQIVRETIQWPNHKPSAMVTLDDRAIPFDGTWPSIVKLLDFEPWYRRRPIQPNPFEDD